MDISSKTLTTKVNTATKWRGASGSRHGTAIKNVVLLVKYVKGGLDTDVKVQVYANSTLGNGGINSIPKSIFIEGSPAASPDKYIPKAVPISLEADGTFQFFFQVSDNEVTFEVEVNSNAGANGTLQVELGDA